MKPKQSSLKEQLLKHVDSREVVQFIDTALVAASKRLPSIDERSSRLSILMFRVSALLSYDHEAAVHRPSGLTRAGFHILWILWLTGPLASSGVARLAGSSRASISGVSRTLEKQGLVSRSDSKTDGRGAVLALTEKGKRRCESVWLKLSERGRAMLRGFSKAEVDTLISLLGKLAEVTAANLQSRI
jgi:DNA-binding MarR family transcriptional regulator